MKKLVTIILVMIVLSACSSGRIEKISSEDKIYYEGLDEFNLRDKDKIEKYIEIYVKLMNLDIQPNELKYLEDMTDKQLFEVLKVKFMDGGKNETEYNTDKFMGEGVILSDGEIVSDSGGADDNSTMTDNVKVVGIIYSYRDNLYIGKLALPSGKIYLLYFKVKDGKVVEVYDK